MANPNIVNVATINAGNASWDLPATLTSTLFTVSAEVIVKVNAILCTNVHATDAGQLDLYIAGMQTTVTGVTITATTPATTAFYLAKNVNIPAADMLNVIDKPIYLMEADVLKGGANYASTLALFISYEIINDA